ncbi:unnamed protein product [Pelagomonas calceolata]|uniref:Uncharacterized protein n=1 Tax=Pelagomonas calceolata TaxID=35677 RepID=A0A8J2X5V2_9STRA|nr:unnamed protein product [Pelagomonas calceolata]
MFCDAGIMYMRAALLALALGQASALLSSPPSDDKHASALTSPPNDDKHASALSSPPSDDKFAVLRGLDDAQVMAEVARRNLNACDGAPPQEHRALAELHYSFKYECECDPTPEPTPAPSPSPTVSPTITTTTSTKCETHFHFSGEHKDYHACRNYCEHKHPIGDWQLPCLYDEHVDLALEAEMSAYPELKGVWLPFTRYYYNKYWSYHKHKWITKTKWKWEGCKDMHGHAYCVKEGSHVHECVPKENSHGEGPPYFRWEPGEPNTSGGYVRKSFASGHDWEHNGGMADIKGDCVDFECVCQKKCH